MSANQGATQKRPHSDVIGVWTVIATPMQVWNVIKLQDSSESSVGTGQRANEEGSLIPPRPWQCARTPHYPGHSQ